MKSTLNFLLIGLLLISPFTSADCDKTLGQIDQAYAKVNETYPFKSTWTDHIDASFRMFIRRVVRRLGFTPPNLIVESNQKRAAAIHELLKQAFYPFTEALKNKSENLPADQFQKIYSELSQKYPLFHSRYRRNFAILDSQVLASGPLMQKTEFKASQQLIYTNADASQKHYKFHKDPQSAKHATFLWSPPFESFKKYGELSQMLHLVITPVGAYGEEFSENLLRTTQVLLALADQELEELSKDTLLSGNRLLVVQTARSRNALSEETPLEIAPLSTFLEGIISYHQFLTFILAEKIPGLDSGLQALHEVTFGGSSRLGLVSEFTTRLPMGLIGPVTLSGVYYPQSLSRGKNGQLVLSDSLKEKFKELLEIHKLTATKSLCPMASLRRRFMKDPKCEEQAQAIDPTGLQLLAETYWNIYQRVKDFR